MAEILRGRQISRRHFLATGALGLAACARGTANLAREGTAMDDALLYVGTYTEDTASKGIYLVAMQSRTGALREVGLVNAGPNPSFLAMDPNGRTLYAVNEVGQRNQVHGGGVTALSIASGNGQLTRLNEQSSGGAGPCFVSVDRSGRAVLVANYDAGSVALLPIKSDGSVAAATQVIQHSGKGPDRERQATPHAHSIITDPSNRFALSADLGADRVFVYRFDGQSLRHVEGGDAIIRPGAGPRHIVFHPSLPLVYVANELDSSVATLRLDVDRGGLSLVETHPTVPTRWTGRNYPADIHIDASGRTLYVSNRGHNSITVFRLDDSGALTLDQVVSTDGDWPRNFTLDPSGRWLLVANQKSNSIVALARDPDSGRLTSTSHKIAVPSPVCLRFGVRRVNLVAYFGS
jgi:6-phosphogluconolactonase